MRGSLKAKLIVFLIISVMAFCISSAFATLTIHENHDSYKLKSIKNDNFEPSKIEYVPTYIPKNDTNTTNDTAETNATDYINKTIENWTGNYIEWENDKTQED